MVRKAKTEDSLKARDFMESLIKRMESCPNAESLNKEVLMPFAAALEAVCGARGYVLNIYGETSNIIFTGDPDDAEEIFRSVDSYLESRDESAS